MGRSQESISADVTATIASTGQAAPFLQAGASPFRLSQLPSALKSLSKLGRFNRGPKSTRLDDAIDLPTPSESASDVPNFDDLGFQPRSTSTSPPRAQIGTEAESDPAGALTPEGTVTIFRVDDNAFDPRISSDGSIPFVKKRNGEERALFININQPQRAKEFAEVNRGGNATITAVEADASILRNLRSSSVHDQSAAAGASPDAPLNVDTARRISLGGERRSKFKC